MPCVPLRPYTAGVNGSDIPTGWLGVALNWSARSKLRDMSKNQGESPGRRPMAMMITISAAHGHRISGAFHIWLIRWSRPRLGFHWRQAHLSALHKLFWKARDCPNRLMIMTPKAFVIGPNDCYGAATGRAISESAETHKNSP